MLSIEKILVILTSLVISIPYSLFKMGLFNRSNSSSDAGKEKEDRGGAMHSIKEALGVRGKDEPAPDAAMKWGISPDKYPPPVYSKSEEEYTPEERAERQKQREKGVDPDLKVSENGISYAEVA